MSDFTEIFDAVKNSTNINIATIQKLFLLMAKAQLSTLEEEQIFLLLAKKSAFAKNILKTEYGRIKSLHGFLPVDAGIAISQGILETEFNGGHLLMYVPSQGFFNHNLKHWAYINDNALLQRIMPFVSKNKHLFEKRSVISVSKEALQCLKSMVYQYKPEAELKSVISTQNKEVFLNEDGSYDVKDHDPSTYLFSCLPCNYDPNATAPLYKETMLEMFANCENPEEVFRHWNEFLGYVIQAVRFAKSVWFLIGGGDNGKSTALNLIKALLGDSIHSCDISVFQKDNFRYRALIGKKALIDEDFKLNLLLDTGFLKKQSENTWYSARSPHKMDTLSFQNTALPILVGNNSPRCSDTSYGWRRRVYVIPFERKFKPEEIDPERFNKIKETELSGILNYALAGYERLCQRGKKFDVPPDCKKAAERMMEESNPILIYLKERIAPSQGNHSYIFLSDLKEDIRQWSVAQGFAIPELGNNLKKTLENLGFTVGKMGNPSIGKSGNALKFSKFKNE